MVAVETYYEDGRWHHRPQGVKKPTGSYELKPEAVMMGKLDAQIRKTEHIVKNMDGTISYRNSYGNDPSSSRG